MVFERGEYRGNSLRRLSKSGRSKPSSILLLLRSQQFADRYGGMQADVEQKLRNAVRYDGTRDFITEDDASPGLPPFFRTGSIPTMLGSVVLIWWVVMVVFQGEGLELDLQRRRHPMWEWLFTHPVSSGAVFSRTCYLPWPPIQFIGVLLYWWIFLRFYLTEEGSSRVLFIGIPVTVAAACLGKALEIGVILRFPQRSRGAIIGLMSWLGYASMMLFFVGLVVKPKLGVLGRP